MMMIMMTTTTTTTMMMIMMMSTTTMMMMTTMMMKRASCSADSKVPAYYYIDERSAQIIHYRLRLQMINLSDDMFKRYLCTNSKCLFGYSVETTEHYLLHCPNYKKISAQARYLLSPNNQTETRTVLCCNLELRFPENEHVFMTVQKFIRKSKRL